MGLCLTFKPQERATIGGEVRMTVVRWTKSQVVIDFECPKDIDIIRENAKVKIGLGRRIARTHGADVAELVAAIRWILKYVRMPSDVDPESFCGRINAISSTLNALETSCVSQPHRP